MSTVTLLWRRKIFIAFVFLTANVCYGQKSLDNHFDVTVVETDSVHIPRRYQDQANRDSIASNNPNQPHRALENYLLAIENPGITRIPEENLTNEVIKIKLLNGRILTLKREDEISDFVFVEFFKELRFLLFRVEWTEGFHYLLIDFIDGKQTKLIGHPVFSPDKKFMVSTNYGSPDEWVKNGFELYKITGRGFKKIWVYDPMSWAPMNLGVDQ
jgi:hypothetical protein